MDIDIAQKLSDLTTRSEKERRRFFARRPKGVKDVIATVMAKQGYAAVKGIGAVAQAWGDVANRVLGDAAIARQTCAGAVKRGVLEVTVANHVVMQEINFLRPGLTKAIQEAMPDARITSLRFKVGRIQSIPDKSS